LERAIIVKDEDMDRQGVVEWSPRKSITDRRRNRPQKIAAVETDVAVDRPSRPSTVSEDRSTDVHNMHRVKERSTARSTESTDCKYPTLCWAPDRPTGRPVEEVGRPPGRPTCGAGCFSVLETGWYKYGFLA